MSASEAGTLSLSGYREVVRLSSDVLSAAVAPSHGARVVSLVDRRTGREWLTQAPPTNDSGEEATYLAAQAAGWDECFPTVAPCDSQRTPWRRRLRDHGDLWGRPWTIDAYDRTRLVASRAGREFVFRRTLEIEEGTLRCGYSVQNLLGEALPFLWSQHALLAVTPSDCILLPEADFEVSFCSYQDVIHSSGSFGWPGPMADIPIRLDRVQPADAAFACKSYSRCPSGPIAVGDGAGTLTFSWAATDAAAVGIWINAGGWPNVGSAHHIAIEPTTAPVDHLSAALRRGEASFISPHGEVTWTVTLSLGPGISEED